MNDCNCPLETASTQEASATIHRPQFHTQEDANGACLQIALPGVRKENINLTLHESGLRVEADRTDAVPETWKTHRDAHAIHHYGLDIRLTARLDGTRASASFDAGVLTLHIPLREEAKPRQIAVN